MTRHTPQHFLETARLRLKAKLTSLHENYLLKASLHGFKHIAKTAKSGEERAAWIAVMIVLSIFLSSWIRLFNEYQSAPIATKIELIPLSEVPYNAIVVDPGKTLDHLGFVKQTGNAIKSKDVGTWGELKKLN